MPAVIIPPKRANHTIELSHHGHINALIGQCGRLLMDDGQETWRVIDVMRAARAAAQISDEEALSVLEAVGFRFVKH
jgi:uncharacterized membrane protein YjjP (DUF1212 family)